MTPQQAYSEFISTKQYPHPTPNVCETCGKFACPLVMKFPSEIRGCDREIMEQVWGSRKRGKSKAFEDVCKELGL
jgi:hypothetical protein